MGAVHSSITHRVQLSQLDAVLILSALADFHVSREGSRVVVQNLYDRLARQVDAERANAGLTNLRLSTH